MKINNFIELVNNSKNKMLKGEQLQQFISKALEVKSYLSIKDKKDLIDNIINSCILFDNGVFKFDEIDKYICFTMMTIAAYTNLELSRDMEEDYDALCEAKLLNAVIETFDGEYNNVKILLQMKCDYILSGNNIEEQIGRFLHELLEKLDKVSGALADKVDKFDFSKLPVSKEDLGKLLEFVNANK